MVIQCLLCVNEDPTQDENRQGLRSISQQRNWKTARRPPKIDQIRLKQAKFILFGGWSKNSNWDKAEHPLITTWQRLREDDFCASAPVAVCANCRPAAKCTGLNGCHFAGGILNQVRQIPICSFKVQRSCINGCGLDPRCTAVPVIGTFKTFQLPQLV